MPLSVPWWSYLSSYGKSKGKEVDPWYAGKNYDDDTDNAKAVLKDLATYYPDAKEYEVAGFFWWQGAKDQNPNHAARYEVHLVELIKSLRKEFNAPNAPFVVATLGIKDGNHEGFCKCLNRLSRGIS